jgi:hypothetical protein
MILIGRSPSLRVCAKERVVTTQADAMANDDRMKWRRAIRADIILPPSSSLIGGAESRSAV